MADAEGTEERASCKAKNLGAFLGGILVKQQFFSFSRLNADPRFVDSSRNLK
jgi:hypothetical protein